MVQIRPFQTAVAIAVLVAGTAVLLSQVSTAGESTVQGDIQSYMTARAAAYSTATSFSFGVFSDIHMSDDPTAVLTRAQWAALLNNWKTQGNLFGVIVGDLGYGNLADRDNVLSGPAAVPGAPPVFYAMGNHEDDAFGKKSWIDALYPGGVRSTSWTSNPAVPAGNLDRVYWSFNAGPTTHLVFLDGDYQTRDTQTRQWQTLGPAQLSWLASDLAANTDKNVCVFIHEPIDQQVTGITPHLTLNDKGPLLELLSQHPKKTYVFSGHLHGLSGVTKWKGVTSVHVMTGVAPAYGIRVTVSGDTITLSGQGTSTITDYDANPINQIVTIGTTPVLKVAEDGTPAGNSSGPKMTPVAAENGVTPTAGSLMLRADAITNFSPRFIAETLVKVVPGLHFSYDINLLGVSSGRDAVAVQPYWYLKDGSVPAPVYDQNWIALSRHPRTGLFYYLFEDTPTLGGRATGTWYHRDFDLTPMSGGWVDGIFLASNFNGANVSTAYVDNIRFTWPPAGTVIPAPRVNIASVASGAVALASSSYSASYPPIGGNDGDRRGSNWAAGGAWNDGTVSIFPDWYEVDFATSKTIDEIDVFSVQDNYLAPIDPTPTMGFSLYGLRDFEVQYWNGSAWIAVPGGTVTGNGLIWRKFTFPALTTSRIRLWITNSLNSYSRLSEIEAYEVAPAGGNAPPTASLTAPASGSSFSAPASITIAANASDPDGSIAKVDFYANGALIGTDFASPYSVTWPGVSAGSYSLSAIATDNVGAPSPASPAIGITVTSTGGRTNVALAANGGTAIASSMFGAGWGPSGTINGERNGLSWESGGGWNDANQNAYPDWLEVDFSGLKSIDEIDVFTVQNSYASPSAPTPTMAFTLYGVRDFEVQYWNGSVWTPVTGGTVVGNTLVWRQFVFSAVTTSKIRVWVTRGTDGYSRLTEVEAYGVAAGNVAPTVTITSPTTGTTFGAPASTTIAANAADADGTIASVAFYANGSLIGTDITSPYSVSWSGVATGSYSLTAVATDNLGATATSSAVGVTVGTVTRANVALASNGATAVASSIFGTGWGASGAINGDRRGASWESGGGWNDASRSVYPDWLEVDFSATKILDEIDVFTVQDAYLAPVTPTSTTTFSLYGIRDFEVQYWNGSAWATVQGTSVTGNSLVWRQFFFSPITTSKIRIWVTRGADGYSRLTEVEAWGTPGGG